MYAWMLLCSLFDGFVVYSRISLKKLHLRKFLRIIRKFLEEALLSNEWYSCNLSFFFSLIASIVSSHA